MGCKFDHSEGFTVTFNQFINDDNLTLRAKGLLLTILSKPDGWKFSSNGLAIQCKDGASSVKAGLQELEENGYLLRTQSIDAKGRFEGYDYHTYGGFSVDRYSVDRNSVDGKTTDIVNTNKVNTHLVNTQKDIDISRSSKDSLDISSCVEPFSEGFPQDGAEQKNETVFIEIPTNKTGENFPVTEKYLADMQALYQGIDVKDEVKKATAWCINNQKKRKTKSGMPRFLNEWFSKAQNRAGNYSSGRSGRRLSAVERDYQGLPVDEDRIDF